MFTLYLKTEGSEGSTRGPDREESGEKTGETCIFLGEGRRLRRVVNIEARFGEGTGSSRKFL